MREWGRQVEWKRAWELKRQTEKRWQKDRGSEMERKLRVAQHASQLTEGALLAKDLLSSLRWEGGRKRAREQKKWQDGKKCWWCTLPGPDSDSSLLSLLLSLFISPLTLSPPPSPSSPYSHTCYHSLSLHTVRPGWAQCLGRISVSLHFIPVHSLHLLWLLFCSWDNSSRHHRQDIRGGKTGEGLNWESL